MILIKNGYIIDPASGFEDYADIVIEDGIIKKIGCLDGDYDNAVRRIIIKVIVITRIIRHLTVIMSRL